MHASETLKLLTAQGGEATPAQILKAYMNQPRRYLARDRAWAQRLVPNLEFLLAWRIIEYSPRKNTFRALRSYSLYPPPRRFAKVGRQWQATPGLEPKATPVPPPSPRRAHRRPQVERPNTRLVRKVGNSLVVCLPPSVLGNLKAGDRMEFEGKGGVIMMRRLGSVPLTPSPLTAHVAQSRA